MMRSIFKCFTEVSRRRTAGLAALFYMVIVAMPAAGQSPVSLADQPPFATLDVPGNLALTPSVEFPTAISVANLGNYLDGTTYLGYFDPAKCYAYKYDSSAQAPNYYFQAQSLATGTNKHSCSGQWSGNFMNWATMQTIDPFRWALTGGYRSQDDSVMTILEKAWAPGSQGQLSNFPYRGTDQGNTSGHYLTVSIGSVTPFSSWTKFDSAIFQNGNMMVFSQGGSGYKSFYTNNSVVNLPTTIDSTVNKGSNTTTYKVYVRVRVCDTSVLGVAGIEGNCKGYGTASTSNGTTTYTSYKPEGLMQQYSNKIRFAALSYLNADGATQQGGVLREPMGYIGPTYPTPLSTTVTTNTRAEWDPTTGIMNTNPDPTTATASGVSQSGVMNYLNQFGEYRKAYESHDNVSELYYAAIRYFEKLGNVSQWDSSPSANALDGFPAVVSWDDPILYRCQKNFILGIGDDHTWYDYNVGGASSVTGSRTMPSAVASDKFNQADTWTFAAQKLEGMTQNAQWNWTSGDGATYYIAGLAYGAHVLNIRPDLHTKDSDISTISTYWMDVMEYQVAEDRNPYWLAAKYGGFSVPSNYSITNTTPLKSGWYDTTNLSVNMNGNLRDLPDNYFLANNAQNMVTSLTTAFRNIANAITPFTTSFALPSPIVTTNGEDSFSSQYSVTDWTDTITDSKLTLAPDGTPALTQQWKSSATLETQLSGTGWQTKRAVATWDGTKGVPFEPNGTSGGGITSSQQSALQPTNCAGYGSTTACQQGYLGYLRGDRTNEVGSTVSGSFQIFRARKLLLGDITDASLTAVGVPSMSYSESHNPGYAAFVSAQASRPTIVYAAANDGMLHAFLDSNGTEQFAYVPSALFQGPNNTPQVDGLAALGNPNFAHHNYVDATPQAFDLYMNRACGTSSTAPSWCTLLIGGLGKGGKSYYALDVTSPGSLNVESAVAKAVVWEFTDSTMGYSFGAPNVVKTAKYGWVVLMTSGYDNSDGYGYLYVVNPVSGALLEKVKTPALSNGLTQASAYVQDYTDYTADSAYVGDLNGQVWRFDLTGTTGSYPAPTKIATLTDASGNAQPVTSPPLIEIHPTTRLRYIMLGTGRLLASQDVGSSATQTFYAIVDGTAGAFSTISTPITRSNLTQVTSLLNGVGSPASMTGWYYDMTSTGERVIIRPAAYSGIIAWGSTIPAATDPCAPSGATNVYAVNFATGQTVLYTLGNATTPAAYFALANSITDLRFLKGANGVELVAGDNKGGVTPVPANLNGIVATRLLNWTEIPTAE